MKNKSLPYSLEAEKSILGCLILDNNKWDEVISIISSKDFFSKSNELIFIEIEKLIHIKCPIDVVTLTDALKKKRLLKKIGGFEYVSDLIKNDISLQNIIIYSKLVKEYAVNRELIFTANEIADYVYNHNNLNSHELLDYAESKIFQINQNFSLIDSNVKKVDILLNKTLQNIESLKNNPNCFLTGLDTGFSKLNEITLGFQKSELIIIAARPSLGKTTFALNICENIAFLNKKPVLIFSLEMNADQIIMKMLSSLSKIELTKIRTGNLNVQEWNHIQLIKKKIQDLGLIYIDDSPRMTPTELRIKSRRLFKEHGGLSAIMIDYLQLMHVPGFRENRTLEISEISRSLKSLAKELQIPVIALSQLNRSLEQRANKRPVNSDLRDSGAIEQDADLIIFIHKADCLNDKINDFLYELIISKQRNGPIGILKILFNKKCSRFLESSKIKNKN